MIFRAVESCLLVVRVSAVIYFCSMAYMHSRYQGEKKDFYTIATFLCLGLSIISFIFCRLSTILEDSILAMYQNDKEKFDHIKLWLDDNKLVISTVRAILRVSLGYLF